MTPARTDSLTYGYRFTRTGIENMPSRKGKIVLMGSGELTATMVEVHKELLGSLPEARPAVFLDTPAGFQLNVDQISDKAVAYFETRVQHPLSIASFKSSEEITPFEAEQAFRTIREAGYILIGPGSPTYAVRHLEKTPLPDILGRRIERGGCLVAASAAALTLGRFTLPVYELYKVGEDLHWVDGLDILSPFGLNLVVVPHWNNAEGGTHDTRFCFMGETRFRKLETMLPEDVLVLGMDEHTACIIDLAKNEAAIRGIGRVILRKLGSEVVFEKGARFPLDVLRGKDFIERVGPKNGLPAPVEPVEAARQDSFWERINALESRFRSGLESDDAGETTSAFLELDRTIWEAQKHLENDEFITQAREVLRDLVVLLGLKLDAAPLDRTDAVAPLVEELLRLREYFRKQRQWEAADAIRDSLQQADIIIEDTRDGSRWRRK
jgi:hypothetical protein